MRTDKPGIVANKVAGWYSYGRVAMAQDTGAGIVGPGRVDVFFGTGEYAQQASAVTTRAGEIYALLAK
jgi:membrane-bound lytic murein transglycosylase A